MAIPLTMPDLKRIIMLLVIALQDTTLTLSVLRKELKQKYPDIQGDLVRAEKSAQSAYDHARSAFIGLHQMECCKCVTQESEEQKTE